MLVCTRCGKGKNILNASRHRKGHAGGTSGTWSLRAPIHRKVQLPNLHIFKGKKYCTSCLRMVKPVWKAPAVESASKPQAVA